MTSPVKKGKKRERKEENWKKNVLKKLKISGKEYESHTSHKRMVKAKKIKPPCKETCKLQCRLKLTEEEREAIFNSYWGLDNNESQWNFISKSMEPVCPRYRYIREGGIRPRRHNNNSFYFYLPGKKIRVCKTFFKATLDITDRPIRTVTEKQHKVANTLLEKDQRGKHGKQPKIDERIKADIKDHISSIPKIESHYTRANTSKHFIDGSKSIAEIHKDYVAKCKEKNVPFGNYILFYRIFTEEFNISFFRPKKDLCDTCTIYNNCDNEEKKDKQESYELHLNEKELSRLQKVEDKEKKIQWSPFTTYKLFFSARKAMCPFFIINRN